MSCSGKLQQSTDKPMFTNACICLGLMIVFRLFVRSTGGPNEVHGQPHPTDERDPEWNKDFEVLRLGEGLPGEGVGPQRKGAQSPEEVSDPLFHLHRILQLLLFPGKGTKVKELPIKRGHGDLTLTVFGALRSVSVIESRKKDIGLI